MSPTELCAYCDHPVSPNQTQCPQCRRFFPDKLIISLRNSDPAVRERAAHDFVFITMDEHEVRALANALNDPSENVRRAAGLNLFIAGPKAKYVVSELVASLDHPDFFIRRASAAALSNVGADAGAALKKLEQLKDTSDEKLRAWVVHAISAILSQPTV